MNFQQLPRGHRSALGKRVVQRVTPLCGAGNQLHDPATQSWVQGLVVRVVRVARVVGVVGVVRAQLLVWGVGLRDQSSGCRVQSSGFSTQGLGCRLGG